MKKKLLAGTAIALGTVALWAGPAAALHAHFVVTPNGNCHPVASGQTEQGPGEGGYHQYHEHVHVGATESTTAPDTLGDGNAQVNVYKNACPAP